MEYPYSGILYSSQKGLTRPTFINMDESQTMLNEKSQLLKDIYNDTIDVYFLKAGKINLHIVHKHLTRKTKKNIHIFFTSVLTSGA